MATVKSHWTQDETGQWWWVTKWHRTRGQVGTCEFCGERFPYVAKKNEHNRNRRYCSIPCANRAQGANPSINLETARRGGDKGRLRWAQDGDGNWWELRQNGKPHTRAEERTCKVCGDVFIARVAQKVWTCSRACGAKLHRNRRMGQRSRTWKGGRMKQRDGYVLAYAPDHPHAMGPRKRYVREHRLVMEKVLGRYLKPNERVHHLNGVKDDNRPANLELWGVGHPAGEREIERTAYYRKHKRHCPTCTCDA